MPNYSEDQILGLAPDESSVKSGRELASTRKWSNTGANEIGLWGECQGSGKSPYQTCVDFNGPAFKCNCPSRKFPCKHGIALLLLFVKEQGSFSTTAKMPEWAEGWISGRADKAEKKAKKEDDAKPPDPVAKAKRQADRQAKVDSGIADLDRWLQDRIRQGLSTLASSNHAMWEQQAARLTDAQAPGLARMLRQCADIPNSHEGWPEHLLSRLSLLHLATQGYSRIDQLDEDVQHDLRSIIGFTVSQEDLLKQDGIKDHWQVMGQRVEYDERMKTQRTWLRGVNTRQWALILQFAFGMAQLDISFQPGHIVEAELVFFPGSLKLRALAKNIGQERKKFEAMDAYESAEAFLVDYAKAMALNPWMETFPCALRCVTPVSTGVREVVLVDSKKNIIPLRAPMLDDTAGHWNLLALSGGRPLDIFGEWSGRSLMPLFTKATPSLAANSNSSKTSDTAPSNAGGM